MRQADMPIMKKQKKNEPPHLIGSDHSGATIERRQERDRVTPRPPTSDKDDDVDNNCSTEQAEATIHHSCRPRRQHLRGVVLQLPPPQPLRTMSRSLSPPTAPPQHHHHQVFTASLPDALVPLCPLIIEMCESYACAQRQRVCQQHSAATTGWQSDMYSLTKQDLALTDVVAGHRQREEDMTSGGGGGRNNEHDIDIFHPLTDHVRATINRLYRRRDIVLNRPRVVKYDAWHTHVPLHYDHCAVTVNLCLNDDYEGGGTYLVQPEQRHDHHHPPHPPSHHGSNGNNNSTTNTNVQLVRLRRGEFLIHPGHVLHGARPITSGTRYILVFFSANKDLEGDLHYEESPTGPTTTALNGRVK